MEELKLVENHQRQFGFPLVSINLNYTSPELEALVAPTDTRRRGDQRLFEQGKVDEADEEKVRLEVKQRKARKLREDAGGHWQANFFREVAHPMIAGERQFEFIGENSYWERRAKGDWIGLPDLW